MRLQCPWYFYVGVSRYFKNVLYSCAAKLLVSYKLHCCYQQGLSFMAMSLTLKMKK